MNFEDSRPIGIFDSGVGGLSVLDEIKKVLPTENFVYMSDTLRMPYGERSEKEIVDYTRECLEKLKEENVKIVVIASSTSSGSALEIMKEEFDFPVIGVIGASAVDSALDTKKKKILILSTNATAKSEVYVNAIEKIDSRVECQQIACPKLIKAIEDALTEDEVEKIIVEYLEPFKDFDYDILLLGSTHFSFAEKIIEKILIENNKKVKITNPSESLASSLETIIKDMKFSNDKGDNSVKYIVTGDVEKFKKSMDFLCGIKNQNVIKFEV